ncbi:hypothetical protein HPT25_13955 [Bacillus sp. BRMEA1]|uniref:hypothetical protein n=1 Tax=Neobacillus endophyticus TaxID=2738405 RepID=UPI0015662FDB|nr:hypothetical protein [Neobacillus endophyticus]NRD78467.1 hypothetical protein [Neobacillus endophyticus]
MLNKKIIALLLSCLLIVVTTHVNASVYVHGYYRKDGTYVRPHYRSDPDGNFNNNWSTKGNINPYTGEEGTKTHPEYPSGGNNNVPDQSNSTNQYDDNTQQDSTYNNDTNQDDDNTQQDSTYNSDTNQYDDKTEDSTNSSSSTDSNDSTYSESKDSTSDDQKWNVNNSLNVTDQDSSNNVDSERIDSVTLPSQYASKSLAFQYGYRTGFAYKREGYNYDDHDDYYSSGQNLVDFRKGYRIGYLSAGGGNSIELLYYENPYMVYTTGGVILLIGVIAFIIIKRKKKRDKKYFN